MRIKQLKTLNTFQATVLTYRKHFVFIITNNYLITDVAPQEIVREQQENIIQMSALFPLANLTPVHRSRFLKVENKRYIYLNKGTYKIITCIQNKGTYKIITTFYIILIIFLQISKYVQFSIQQIRSDLKVEETGNLR